MTTVQIHLTSHAQTDLIRNGIETVFYLNFFYEHLLNYKIQWTFAEPLLSPRHYSKC